MSRYVMVQRTNFVEARYERFKQKKEMLSQWPEGTYVLTDLDRTYAPFEKPMKDVVICDRCQEDVLDDHLVMLEGQMVYHLSCVKDDHDFKMNPVEMSKVAFENVIPLFRR